MLTRCCTSGNVRAPVLRARAEARLGARLFCGVRRSIAREGDATAEGDIAWKDGGTRVDFLSLSPCVGTGFGEFEAVLQNTKQNPCV